MLPVVIPRPNRAESTAPAVDPMASHPLIAAAAEGSLPDWAVAEPERRTHMGRVAELMDSWAEASGLPRGERERWRAAAWLHDALRDASPAQLQPLVPEELADLPAPLLHGPAAAELLRGEGVEDAELLMAIRYHTLGHADFGTLGRALYAADFLEPGRTFAVEGRQELTHRGSVDVDAVALEVARARIAHRLARNQALNSFTVGFWNALVTGRGAS